MGADKYSSELKLKNLGHQKPDLKEFAKNKYLVWVNRLSSIEVVKAIIIGYGGSIFEDFKVMHGFWASIPPDMVQFVAKSGDIEYITLQFPRNTLKSW